jgi:acetyl coenzyme A synthetase (ADP forming)-like protein
MGALPGAPWFAATAMGGHRRIGWRPSRPQARRRPERDRERASPPRSVPDGATRAENVLRHVDDQAGTTTTTGSEALLLTEPLPVTYPAEWEVDAMLSDGGAIHLRPIRPDDGAALTRFHARLSPDTVYLRFFSVRPHLSARDVARFTLVDYSDRMAFVGVLGDSIVGVGRYDRCEGTNDAEVAFVVDDAQQGRGLGSLFLEYLAEAARDKGITRFIADTLVHNRRMLDVFEAAGYRESERLAQGVVRVTFDIEPTGASIAAMEQRAWTAGVHSIDRLLRPRSIAVVGAGRDPRSIGHAVVRNLVEGGFRGQIYPINAHAATATIAGLTAHASVEAIPGEVDVAVIALPAVAVLSAARDCGRKGVRGLVVISSGFAETGDEGRALQRALLESAHRDGMRVVGPNCMGIINTAPEVRMDATFASQPPIRGSVAFASQSGALGIALLERARALGLGVSSFVSMGNKADVSSNDLLRYWSQDPATRVILFYLESFGNPRTFARVASVVARRTPIVALKAGRSVAGSRAAASHTASMASPDVAVDALFNQTGVIRVDTVEELLDTGSLLAHQPLPRGSRVAVLGNAGGAGILAADACQAAGLELPALDATTQAALRNVAGPNSGVGNPVDLGAGLGAEPHRRALSALLSGGCVDAVIVIHAPVPQVDVNDVARVVAETVPEDVPVVFIHLARDDVPEPLRAGSRSIPCFPFPERAAHALARVAEHARWLRRPVGAHPELVGFDTSSVQSIATTFLGGEQDGGWLGPKETVELLRAAGIPVLKTAFVRSSSAASAAARRLGGAVALKVVADGIVHKSDVGGVRLELRGGAAAARAYRELTARAGPSMRGALVQPMAGGGVEVIVGLVNDPLFGPLLMFGTGGTSVELLGDRAFRTLPLTDVDAAELVRTPRGSALLFGHRGAPPCDVTAVEDLLLRVARLAEELPQLAEMDLNPVVASPDGACVVDARLRLVPWHARPEQLVRRLR